MAGLHCPKCGGKLTRNARGSLECSSGRMEISASLERRLIGRFVEGLRASASAPVRIAVGGKWYCPACGVLTHEASRGDLRCPSCNHSLSEFMHELTELHPHWEGTSWR